MSAADTTTLLGRSPTSISSWGQLSALTRRGVLNVIKSGEFIFSVVSPLFLAVCFYLPLHRVMERQGIDYAQFLIPIIVLQSVGFAAGTSAMRASMDLGTGIDQRLRVLPINRAIPTLARMATNVGLLTVSIIFASLICLVIGWRPQGGLWGTISLYALALAIGVIVSLLADGIGMMATSPQATSQLTGLPMIILGMCSTGFSTIERFPEWIRPFARNQPISQLATAMRSLDEGNASWYTIGPTVWWCLGLLALGSLLLTLGIRKANKATR